jgi:membrane protease subunit HflK
MDKNVTGLVIGALVAILIVFAGLNSYYSIQDTEVGVIQRFGEVTETIDDAGIHFKIPFIEQVTVINVKDLRSIQYGYRIVSEASANTAAQYINEPDESRVITSDQFMLDIGATVQYRIIDAADYLFNTDSQEATIRLAFESVLRRNVLNKNLETALETKGEIASQIKPELQAKLDAYGLGISIDSVQITDVLLPKAVQEAYDNVNIAANEKDAYELRTKKYEEEQLPKARAEALVMVNEAEAYKVMRIAQAKGDVAAFNSILKSYTNSKEITSTRLFIETMEKLLSQTDKIYIIDMENDGNTVKYLPLSGLE